MSPYLPISLSPYLLRIPLALLLCAGVTIGDDAPAFRSTPSRSGWTQEDVAPKSGPFAVSLRWVAALPSTEQIGSPVVAAGRVYVGARDGKVYCFNPDDGATIWTAATSGPVVATPAYFKGRLYAASSDGYLYYLHAMTGMDLIPPVYHGTALQASPLPVADVPYAGSPTGKKDMLFVSLGSPAYELRAYDAKDGSLLWSGTPGFRQISWSGASYHAEYNRVIVGDNSGYWTCYDASTGAWRWTYRAGTNVGRNSAACVGDYVVLPGGGGNDRNVHVLKQLAAAPYFEFHQSVPAIPPPTTLEGPVKSVDGTTEWNPNVTSPQFKVEKDHLDTLLNLSKAERDEFLDLLASSSGQNYDDLKAWLDVQCGDVPANLNKPETDPVSYYNPGRPADLSSPAIVKDFPAAGSHRVLVSLREYSGTSTDSFYTLAIDVTPAPADTKVMWGTQLRPYTASELGIVASPSVSKTNWTWSGRGSMLEVRDLLTGVKAGSVDAGSLITGGPTLADGRVYVTTGTGEVLCYDAANNAPLAPTIFSPAGGTNLTWTDSPVLSWSGHFDVETPGSALVSELQFGVGYANRDLELSEAPPVEMTGASSYPLGSIASNTHVYWRVRVRDAEGARSRWSDVQDFWISKDTVPPEPPAGISAMPLDGAVQVDWSASPSPDILKYRVYWKPSTTPTWAGAQKADDLAGFSYTVAGLSNGTTYDFMVTALDGGENESPGVVASATPQPAVSMGGTVYSSVQQAIDAAAPGQTVNLGVGTFTGNLVLKPGVSLRGWSAKHTRIVGSGVGPVIAVQGAYLTDPVSEIAHLAVTKAAMMAGQTGIDGGTADLYVHHVAVYGIAGNGIEAALGGRLRVVNVVLANNAGRGVSAGTDPALTTVKNCAVAKNGGGVFVQPGSFVSYNTSYLNSPEADYAAGVDGVENRTIAVAFTDETAGDFTEVAGSSSVDAADPADTFATEPQPNGSRRNQGAFGDTALARTSNVPAPPAGGTSSGGACGALGLEFLLVLGLLRLALRGRRRVQSR